MVRDPKGYIDNIFEKLEEIDHEDVQTDKIEKAAEENLNDADKRLKEIHKDVKETEAYWRKQLDDEGNLNTQNKNQFNKIFRESEKDLEESLEDLREIQQEAGEIEKEIEKVTSAVNQMASLIESILETQQEYRRNMGIRG